MKKVRILFLNYYAKEKYNHKCLVELTQPRQCNKTIRYH